jgi:hypothetical protein
MPRPLLIAALLLSGCAIITVGAVAPKPAVELPQSTERLALGLPGIPDSFDVSCAKPQSCTLSVTGFHASLTKGFENAFHSSYTIVEENPDLSLRFQSLRLEVDPNQKLIVNYSAHLNAADGRTVGRSSGKVQATKPISAGAEDALAEALGALYERVASECFASQAR